MEEGSKVLQGDPQRNESDLGETARPKGSQDIPGEKCNTAQTVPMALPRSQEGSLGVRRGTVPPPVTTAVLIHLN